MIGAENSQGGAGAVYVYAYESFFWKYKQTINAPEPKIFSGFGHSIDVNGVSAAISAFNRTGFGSVYVYSALKTDKTRDAATKWAKIFSLTNADAKRADGYGSSVSISKNAIVVGCSIGGTGGQAYGVVYSYIANGLVNAYSYATKSESQSVEAEAKALPTSVVVLISFATFFMLALFFVRYKKTISGFFAGSRGRVSLGEFEPVEDSSGHSDFDDKERTSFNFSAATEKHLYSSRSPLNSRFTDRF